jgi:membrane AbrB-like protein
VVAAAGGLLVGLSGFPAGWLSGAIVFVAAAALAGRPMHVPVPLARAFFLVIGITLGSVVTPDTIRGMAAWPLSIAALALAMLCVTTVTSRYLQRVHGWDPLSALFASFPGAMAQVIALATESKVDLRAVVVVQTLRVVILTVGVPAGLGLFGLVGPATLPGGFAGAHQLGELAVAVTVSVAAGIALFWVGFPGGLIFGAMIPSAILHGTGLVEARLPSWLATAAMVGLGAVTGSRFGNTDIRLLMKFTGAALGSFAVSLAVAAVFALAVTAILSVRISDAVVAFAPGAVDAMMILALALHLDPVYVGAHHVSRVVVVSLSLPLLVRWFGHRVTRDAQDASTRSSRTGVDD